MMLYFIESVFQFLRQFIGTRGAFCATGVASSFIGIVTWISEPSRVAYPVPSNRFW